MLGSGAGHDSLHHYLYTSPLCVTRPRAKCPGLVRYVASSVAIPAQALMLPAAGLHTGERVRVAAWWDSVVQSAGEGRRAHNAGTRLLDGRAPIWARLRARLCRRFPHVVGALAQAAVLQFVPRFVGGGGSFARGRSCLAGPRARRFRCLRGRAAHDVARGL